MNCIVKIEQQGISHNQIAALKNYLKNQPKWRIDKLGERYSDSDLQHYLWRKSSQGTSWHDYCEWPDSKVSRKNLIMPGELFLVDAEAGELWVCWFTSGGKLKKVAQISDDMSRDYHNNFNGYAILPDGIKIIQ